MKERIVDKATRYVARLEEEHLNRLERNWQSADKGKYGCGCLQCERWEASAFKAYIDEIKRLGKTITVDHEEVLMRYYSNILPFSREQIIDNLEDDEDIWNDRV